MLCLLTDFTVALCYSLLLLLKSLDCSRKRQIFKKVICEQVNSFWYFTQKNAFTKKTLITFTQLLAYLLNFWLFTDITYVLSYSVLQLFFSCVKVYFFSWCSPVTEFHFHTKSYLWHPLNWLFKFFFNNFSKLKNFACKWHVIKKQFHFLVLFRNAVPPHR